MAQTASDIPARAELLAENLRLAARLDEAEQTLEAIRTGDVDALLVSGPHGEQVFTLDGADRVYRTIIETMNEAALTVDVDATILFCNPRFGELIGSPLAAIVGQPLTAFAAPPQYDPLRRLLADARQAPVQRRLTLRAADGRPVPCQFAASPLVTETGPQVCLTASDLSELEAAAGSARVLREQQQALEASQATLRSFYDSSTFIMGVAELAGDELLVVHTNAATARFFDTTSRDLAGRSFAAPEINGPWLDRCRHSQVRREPVEFDYEHPTRAGPRWLHATVAYLGDNDAGRPLFSYVAEDVTEQMRAKESLIQLNETLERRVAARTAEAEERAQALRQLAGELGQAEQRERKRVAELLHDGLQQVLIAAQLQTEMLRRQLTDSPLGSTACRLDDLLRQALTTSRGLTAELAPPALYFGDLLAALQWLAHAYRDNHDLTIELTVPPTVGPIEESVKVLLFQAVRELLLNVVKHADVTAAQVGVAYRPDGQIEVSVVDRGRGFALSPGWSAGQPGSGFGLFGVRERIALLGGELRLDSQPGTGTRATLIVPVDSPLPRESAPAAAADETTPPIRVLLVDDHQVVREGLAAVLFGHDGLLVVGEAADGLEAFEQARRLRPDVVVMDVRMPRMDGVEACRLITRELPGTVVIGLSMSDDPHTIAHMKDAGATEFVSKSNVAEQLLPLIRRCV